MHDLIEKLSDLRSRYNCFDENEYEAYHTLSEAIKVLSEQPEPCEDAVSRKAVHNMLENIPIGLNEKWFNWLQKACLRLAELPSVTPKHKTWKWIEYDSDDDKYDVIKCPCCKHTFTVDAYHWTDIGFVKDDFKFCPNCRADMRG